MTNPTRQPLAHRAGQIFGEGALTTLKRALEIEAGGVDMIHLEIGQPDYPTPEHIVDAGIKSIRDGRTRYGPTPGTPELRAAIAAHVAATRHIPIDSQHIMVGPGGKPIIFFTILALVEKGDEVIIPNPSFPTYAATTQFAGGTPVYLPLKAEEGFKIDTNSLRELITPRTKLLILNSPANPTGGVIGQTELEAIAKMAVQHNLWVLSDEIYRRLYYGDTPPPSIASLPGMAERTVILDGFSKAYSMTGWRLGYGVFPEPLLKPINDMFVNAHTCVPLFVQDAGIAALTGPQDFVETMRTEYRARRDIVVDTLNAIPGISCPTPQGAFYAMPTIAGLGAPSSRDFANALMAGGVALLPGTDFGHYGEGYLRISYATAREELLKALQRIQKVSEAWDKSIS